MSQNIETLCIGYLNEIQEDDEERSVSLEEKTENDGLININSNTDSIADLTDIGFQTTCYIKPLIEIPSIFNTFDLQNDFNSSSIISLTYVDIRQKFTQKLTPVLMQSEIPVRGLHRVPGFYDLSLIGTEPQKKMTFKENYVIENSVFEPFEGYPPLKNEKDLILHFQKINEESTLKLKFPDDYMTQEEFKKILNEALELIESRELKIERISKWSSGTYIIYHKMTSKDSVVCKFGVFKPKDEGTYSPLTNTWIKWFRKTFLPCTFGRSCLVPNTDYLCEIAASVLDKQLLSFIVPHTEIIYLRSWLFYYHFSTRMKGFSKLPLKPGSFQIFLDGYMNASSWFKLYPLPDKLNELSMDSNIQVNANEMNFDSKFRWSKAVLVQFREELEKLVILDYIMRNTNRTLDNWMIKIVWLEYLKTGNKVFLKPYLKIGAVDSALSFPLIFPDKFRSFPFGWLLLPRAIIGQPFSMKTRRHYLPLLTSTYWWQTTVIKLKRIFMQDNKFKEKMWLSQLSVLKGQAFNVVEILKNDIAGPLELTEMKNYLVFDEVIYFPVNHNKNKVRHDIDPMKNLLNNPSTRLDKYSNVNTIDQNTELPAVNQSIPLMCRRKSESDLETSKIPKSKELYECLTDKKNVNDKDIRLKKIYEMNTRSVIYERLKRANNRTPRFTRC